ncbi:guanine nucleotide-binding protein G(I)/G(S)/G(O) subunit gamma-12a [Poeciliopsis prolifica]|uniref:guanine nucleotide-binding protein G(I)/G(S)/G(O) subunit gamma-12a n=1 Tax=Poeciliopsis prolifica TaxID=188132 RepID=UPI002413218D|nr:guanine nucleotide-binding protein G(I)/G(S)/G(O) subunit gamma-12a [Poeciliopsis prolifica]
MSSKAVSGNKLNGLRQVVQQLRQEARIERMKISKASGDLMRYCREHEKTDPLIVGIPASENPFKEKKPCTLL